MPIGWLEGLFCRDKPIRTIYDLENYGALQTKYFKHTTEDLDITIEADLTWIILGATMQNDTKPARPGVIIRASPSDNQRFYSEVGVATAATRAANALTGMALPLILKPDTNIIFRDLSHVPFDLHITTIIYYEVFM